MKIRTTLLVGAGALSGLAMSVAIPAGAASASAAPVAVPPPGGAACTGTPYGLDGQLTEGPDAAVLQDGGQLALRGQLCVGDNHGNNGQASPVTGSVAVVEVFPAQKDAATIAMRNPGIPVKGEVVGQSIRLDGRTSLDLNRATNAASTAALAPARPTDVFIRAAGSQPTVAHFNTTLRFAPDYFGTFDGPRLKDAGTFVASADLLKS
jgi:hypothetical protein